MIKVISFDLDKTLIAKNFDKVFWFREIPRLYAEQYQVSFTAAYKTVTAAYRSSSPDKANWYDLEYWFRRFKLKHNWKKVIHDLKHHIRIYKETTPVIKELSKKYRLIVITHSIREFVKVKQRVENLNGYFYRIYSVPSDFKSTKKDITIFKKILKDLKIRPEEMLHIGDSRKYDYEMPRKAGVKTLLLDRTKKQKGTDIIYTLKSVKRFLN